MLNSGKILARFFKSAKYTDDQWELLNTMFEQKQPVNYVCSTFNIKHSHYKVLKKLYQENGAIF